MRRTKQPNDKTSILENQGGRPSKLDTIDYAEVYRLALLGITDEQIAQFYDVDVSTIRRWKKKDPKFHEAVKSGKQRADASVAESLYRRATGYDYEEDYISQYQGEAVVIPTTKHLPPDVGAAKLWLKNRHPDIWSDTQRMEMTGKDGGPIRHRHTVMDQELDLSDFTAEELKVMKKLNGKVSEVATNGSNGTAATQENGSS